jgi:hypothetical protein
MLARVEAWTELHAFTDAFYFLAFRARDVIRRLGPGFGNFDAIGIRATRNDLLAHPERVANPDERIFKQDLFLDDRRGPVLKGGTMIVHAADRSVDLVDPLDADLYVNAQEFADAFLATIGRVLDDGGSA